MVQVECVWWSVYVMVQIEWVLPSDTNPSRLGMHTLKERRVWLLL